MRTGWILGLWCMTLACVNALGHGVQGMLADGVVGVQFVYEGGAPLRAADVTATLADTSETIEGLTDSQGRFAFFPDQPGEWQVEVNDGMGHRARLVVDVDGDGLAVATHTHSHGHHVAPWIVGLSSLFGLFGVWTLWGNRRRIKAKEA